MLLQNTRTELDLSISGVSNSSAMCMLLHCPNPVCRCNGGLCVGFVRGPLVRQHFLLPRKWNCHVRRPGGPSRDLDRAMQMWMVEVFPILLVFHQMCLVVEPHCLPIAFLNNKRERAKRTFKGTELSTCLEESSPTNESRKNFAHSTHLEENWRRSKG